MDLHMGPVHRWAPVSTVTISARLQTELIIEVTGIKLEREAKQRDQMRLWFETYWRNKQKKNTRPDDNWS